MNIHITVMLGESGAGDTCRNSSLVAAILKMVLVADPVIACYYSVSLSSATCSFNLLAICSDCCLLLVALQ